MKASAIINPNKIVTCLALLATAMYASNCATIIRGTTQTVPFNSHPAGARVVVNGMDMGMTPVALELKRNRTHQIVLALEGYDEVVVNLDRKFKLGASVFGNVFSFGVIGLVVDVANGSAYQLTPEQLDRSLIQTGIAVTPLQDGGEGISVVLFTTDQVTTDQAP